MLRTSKKLEISSSLLLFIALYFSPSEIDRRPAAAVIEGEGIVADGGEEGGGDGCLRHGRMRIRCSPNQDAT